MKGYELKIQKLPLTATSSYPEKGEVESSKDLWVLTISG